MRDALNELANIVSAITSLTDDGDYGALTKVRQIPGTWARRVEAISISARDGSYAREAKPEDVEVAKAIRAEMVSRFQTRGIAERDEKLREISARLESLRAILPAIAAKAAVEIGAIARGLEKEASGEN
ncbi:hypothetical protein [Neorhizobium sp. LjRoot104]|uniref:hypothetical protein n=1 Tax=Neorhizobium sp. LjRoot104 TaxID=3342254 RepID=UPI003ED0317A